MTKNEFYDSSELVDIDKVYPNPKNPNVMTDNMFEALVDDIDKNGLIGSILVRKHPMKKGYEIIDGEHRWKACKKLGYDKISIIELDYNDINAVINMVRWNREKGYFDHEKLSKLIGELVEKTNRAVIRERLHIDANEFDNLLEEKIEETSSRIKEVMDEFDDYDVLLSSTSKEDDDLIFNTQNSGDEESILFDDDKNSGIELANVEEDEEDYGTGQERKEKIIKVEFRFTESENNIISDFMKYYMDKNEIPLTRSEDAIINALIFYMEHN